MRAGFLCIILLYYFTHFDINLYAFNLFCEIGSMFWDKFSSKIENSFFISDTNEIKFTPDSRIFWLLMRLSKLQTLNIRAWTVPIQNKHVRWLRILTISAWSLEILNTRARLFRILKICIWTLHTSKINAWTCIECFLHRK